MQKQIQCKFIICVFLLLHTAVSVALAIFAALCGDMFDSTVLFIAVAAVTLILTLYTSAAIMRNVNSRMRSQIAHLFKFSSALQTASEKLDSYADNLQQRESALQKRELIIEEQVKKINGYGDRMQELVSTIDSSDVIPFL